MPLTNIKISSLRHSRIYAPNFESQQRNTSIQSHKLKLKLSYFSIQRKHHLNIIRYLKQICGVNIIDGNVLVFCTRPTLEFEFTLIQRFPV